jgi:poly(A)-specific ribonuclease
VHWKNCKHEGDLTGFDKRLIHQLVRNEFAELVTISRRQSILIKKMDVERELKIRKDKYKRLKKKIYVQTGFRWVIEAMTGGPLSQIDLTWFARNPDTGAPSYYDNVACEARFHRACDKLKRKRPVLVGHNCFTDLIYLYSTFIGKLPETVGEFGLRIHDLFPVIVDTKYMFTHNCGNLNPASSLDSIEESLRTQQTPRIETHKDHGKYLTDELYHEAGYDSYLTARVMILLSTKLGAAGTYVPDDSSRNPPPLTPNEEHKLTASPPPTPQQQDSGGSFVDVRLSVGKVNKSSPRSPNGHSSKQSPAIRTKSRSRFATKTLFEALASSSPSENDNDNDNDDEQAISATVLGSSFALNPAARPFPVVSTGHAAVDVNTVTGGPSRKGKEKRKELKPDALMPPFSSDFWSIYANKLRVFGTVKGMLELDPVRL